MKKVESKSLGAVHTLHLENKKIGSKENLKNRNARLEVKNKERGITLIALVITIIVLLILAGVSVAMLTGQNGILMQANNAKASTANKSAKEKVESAVIATMSQSKRGTLDADKLVKEITDNYGGTVTNNKFPLKVTMGEKYYTIEETGDIKEGQKAEMISFTCEGKTYQVESGMTWRQAFEAGYFSDVESKAWWKELYGTAEKQLSYDGKYYYYRDVGKTTEYVVVDARADYFTVYNNRIYIHGTLYFDANGDVYDLFRNTYYYVIPEGAAQSTSSQVMPDDVITPNGKYTVFFDD